MSWIFGFTGNNIDELKPLFNSVHDSLSKLITYKNLYLAIGGNQRTLSVDNNSKLDNKYFHWAVCGVGIEPTSEGYSLVEFNGWNKIFTSSETELKLNELDGHFVGIKLNPNFIEVFTDQSGLRDIYFANYKGGTLFSTRIDWLSKFIETELDFSIFGSRWMLFNQLSTKSVLKNIYRLVGGSSARLEKGIFKVTENHREYSQGSVVAEEVFVDKLKSIIEIKTSSETALSLSLSGGFDSRLLLSLMLKSKNKNWDTHTVGSPGNPDVKIARQICEDLNINNELFDEPLPEVNELINELFEYIGSTILNDSISTIVNLRNFAQMGNNSNIIIDGGFAEIWRREFFYRIQFKHSRNIISGDIKSIIPGLKILRSDIFNNDVVELMEQGIEDQLDDLFRIIPQPNLIGVENWIDFFALYTRLPNYIGHEQSRVDNYVLGFTPFVQPSLIKLLFNIPVSRRKNGALFRDLIKVNEPSLAKYPLAKGELLIPYSASSISARIIFKIKSKLVGNYSNESYKKLYSVLNDFIFDTLSSESVKNNPVLDQKKVNMILQRSFNNNENYSEELGWLLSYVIFQDLIQKKQQV